MLCQVQKGVRVDDSFKHVKPPYRVFFTIIHPVKLAKNEAPCGAPLLENPANKVFCYASHGINRHLYGKCYFVE